MWRGGEVRAPGQWWPRRPLGRRGGRDCGMLGGSCFSGVWWWIPTGGANKEGREEALVVFF
jgi:hypothetical protein